MLYSIGRKFQNQSSLKVLDLNAESYKTTYKIDHNFGAFIDLFQIESNIDTLYETFMKGAAHETHHSKIVVPQRLQTIEFNCNYKCSFTIS